MSALRGKDHMFESPVVSYPTSGSRARIRVLHVDDESDYQCITKLFLEKFDPRIQVESASSGEEALQLLKEQPFDCVVSDYQMPTMDGLQLCTLVREQCQHPFYPLHGLGQRGGRREGLRVWSHRLRPEGDGHQPLPGAR